MKTCETLAITTIMLKKGDPFLKQFAYLEKLQTICQVDQEPSFEVFGISDGSDHINLLLADNTVLNIKAKSYIFTEETL